MERVFRTLPYTPSTGRVWQHLPGYSTGCCGFTSAALKSVFFIGFVKRADLFVGLVINIMFDLAGLTGGLLLIDPDRDKDFRQKLMTGINALRSIERTCPFLSCKTSIVSR